MSDDPPPSPAAPPPAATLESFIAGPFSASISNLLARSKTLPTSKDFHFFNNFPDFKTPIKSINTTATSSLQSLATSSAVRGPHHQPPQFPDDLDDAYDWLVGLNDEFIEKFSVSVDEFMKSREVAMEEDGFNLVGGKKKRESVNVVIKGEKARSGRSKVPFHVAGIRKPQEEFTIRVNNENVGFEHVWLERSAYGGRWIHPLEKLSVEDFIDRNIGEVDPVKPLPLERTPFKLIEAVNDLREMVAKLRAVNEFAVDLEHNHYRSFQGLTCLMQISTRTEDFVVDTLKLRIQIGPHLREIFKDPSKRKVMHGADRDIIWLQRDFGIYVCNLFDTGQASRVLQLERNSLEYLLHHFCGVTANKEYQNADWRLRPLPNEMVKYAREDTHYLLYIYGVMKRSLISSSSNENDLLLEVYRRSAEICMKLYEKELLTDTSYLYIYGLLEAELNAEQLAVVAGLSQWRDTVARAEDESTGYILPNKTLIEIAKQMPLSPGKLKRLVKSKHPYVERNLSSVLGIIKSSIANSFAFESAVQQLKEARLEASVLQNMGAVGDNIEPDHDVDIDPIVTETPPLDCSLEATDIQVQSNEVSAMNRVGEESGVIITPVSEIGCSSGLSSMCKQVEGEHDGSQGIERKATFASVQLLKKPSSGFGALFGNSSSKRKITPYSTISEQAKNKDKINQIKSNVALPFHYFSGEKPTKSPEKTDADGSLEETPKARVEDATELEEVIPLEERNDKTASPSNSTVEDEVKLREGNGQDSQLESEAAEETMSPSELSSSFGKCFQSINEIRGSQKCRKQAEEPVINFEPFDYAAARKNMNFSDVTCTKKAEGEESIKTSNSKEANKPPASTVALGEEKSRGSQVRRRQAFPPTGNRSMSYH